MVWIKSFVLILIAITSCSVSGQDARCNDFVPVPYKDRIICVSPDYYQVDGVRTPAGLAEAQRIAREHDAFLPTKDMVDAIWEHADIKLAPIPLAPGPQMTSKEYYVRHDRLIDQQLEKFDVSPNTLIAGHKKDIIREQRHGRVTIYGWHRKNGVPIQPVSSVHGASYYDYSHGIRLVRW